MAKKISSQTKQEVVSMLVHGYTTYEIAEHLHISSASVQSIRRTYRAEIDRYSGTMRNSMDTRGCRRRWDRDSCYEFYNRRTKEEIQKRDAVHEIMSIIMR